MRKYKLYLFLILVFIVSCNAESRRTQTEAAKPEANSSSESGRNVSKGSQKSYVDELDYAIINELNAYPKIEKIFRANPCIEKANCEQEVVSAGVAALKDEQILILEKITLPYSSFHIYKDTISGFYTMNEYGSFKRMFPKARVSKPILEVIEILTEQKGELSRRIPNLGKFIYDHNQVNVVNDDFNNTAHSVSVFELAAGKNPDVNFIMADNPVISTEMLCKVFVDEELAFLEFRDKLTMALGGLNKLIKQNSIKYINMSFLSTPTSIQVAMNQVCRKSNLVLAEKIVDYYNRFYLSLLAYNPNIILVQAVPNDDREGYSCPFHNRWIRVGYTNRLHSAIPPQGEKLTPEGLSENLKPVYSCVTVAINGGIVDQTEFDNYQPKAFTENSLFFNYEGLFPRPVYRMATSWATPVLLSYLRAMNIGKSSDETLSSVSNRIFDPIKYKQFMSYK